MANAIDLYRLPAPVVSAPTGVAGGSLVNGTTYYYTIVPWRSEAGTAALANSAYWWHNGAVSNEVSFAAGATNKSCTLNWTNPDTFATAWAIFRTTVSGSYARTKFLAVATTNSYTDVGTATGDQTLNFAADITCDMPAINIRGMKEAITLGAGNTYGTTSGLGYIGGFAGLTVDIYKDRYFYFYTDRARYLDIDGVTTRRYVRCLYNTATTIYFEFAQSVAPQSGDVIYVSWKPSDIYDASVAGTWGNIAVGSYLNAGLPIAQRNGDNNHRFNACVLQNSFAVAGDQAFMAYSRQVVEFGQAARVWTSGTSPIYIRDSEWILNGAPNGETIQASPNFTGSHDIIGLTLRYRFQKSGINSAFGNDSFQPTFGIESPPNLGANRWKYSTFVQLRATGPYLGEDFSSNLFVDCGQGAEASVNRLDGIMVVNPLTNAIRCSAAAEYHIYNAEMIGTKNFLSAYALDGNDCCFINPGPNAYTKLLAPTWSTTPNGGMVHIQYQLGFTFTDTDGNTLSDVMVEVFGKDGNPIYANILDESGGGSGKEYYTRSVYSSAPTVRQVRGAIYPKVKVTEFKLAHRVQGRYSGYSTPEINVSIGEKDPDTAGKYGAWVCPTQTCPAANETGWIYASNEITQTIDPTKVHLAHVFGNYKYLQINMQHNGSLDGLGAKTSSVDETQEVLPTGYGATSYCPAVRVDARRFYSDANGRIPLLDFDAVRVQSDNNPVYLVPWTIRISKAGYKTIEFPFSPSGLYEKEFVLSMERTGGTFSQSKLVKIFE